MRAFFLKYHRTVFFGSWFILNFFQALYTGLMDDEAYYWVYSRFLDWGYFDHPPMIALLIKGGTLLFPGTLGVRFLIVLLNSLTLYLISLLIEKRDDFLFYIIGSSLMLAKIGGILAVPDIPLLFFSSLYFLLYKRFAERTNLVNAVLLGAGIALMLYSKYHGILLVFFTLLSNLKLFKDYRTYVVAAVAVLLMAPHIYWQLSHGLPSIQYHLFERNASSYRFSFTLEYLAGQIALAGPIAGWLLMYGAFWSKPRSDNERALKFSLIGTYLFFLLSSLKGRVEANWTVPAFIPLIVLSHQYFVKREKAAVWLLRLLPFTLLLVIALRIFMAIDIERVTFISKDEVHGNRDWVGEIYIHSDQYPVVFLDSYQKPSKYWFYSGVPAFGLNTPTYRRNNYNFWPLEDSLIGKKVMVVGGAGSRLHKRFVVPYLKDSRYGFVDRYYSFSRIRFGELALKNGQFCFTSLVPAHYLKFLRQEPYAQANIFYAITNADDQVRYEPTGLRLQDLHSTQQAFDLPFRVQLKSGEVVKLAIESCVPGRPSLNSSSASILR